MKFLRLVFLLVVSTQVQAGFIQVVGKVEQLGVVTEQYANIVFSKPVNISSHPCANSDDLFSFDITTDRGKLMYSMFLSSVATQKEVIIRVDDTSCGLFGNQALVNTSFIR